MMYKCIAIDDEPHAIDSLKEYIGSLDNLHLETSYTDPLLALKEITSGEKTDVIFMDVDMPLISGIELSKAIRNKTDKLVFTTSHSKYAFDAFEVEADAYLLKPITFAKFAMTINKLLPPKIGNIAESEKNQDDFFFVKNKEDNLKLVKVRYGDIIAIESQQNYVKIYTCKQQIVGYLSLIEIKNFLKDRLDFLQVHRSFIITKSNIDRIEGNIINLNHNIKITIGDHYRDDVTAFIKQKTLKTGRN